MQLLTIDSCPKDENQHLVYFRELGWQVATFSDDTTNNAGGWSIGNDYYGPPPTHWLDIVLPTPDF